MHTNNSSRTFFLTSLLILVTLPSVCMAQRGKKGPSLVWDHEIVILPNTLIHQDTVLQAFSFTVFETNAKDLMEIWRVDHASKSTSITKGDPMMANGARVEKLSEQPMTILAQTRGDKKAGFATMTVAFIAAADHELPGSDVQQNVVRDMAVRYNRQIVEQQILKEEKALSTSSSKLSKSVSKDEKVNKNIQKTTGSLNKVEAQRMKEQTRNAKLQGDLVGAEHRYTLSKDVKDLKRMTKAREKLSSGESKVAKLMEKEAKLRSSLTRYSGDRQSSSRDKEEKTVDMSSHQATMDALRKKLADIR